MNGIISTGILSEELSQILEMDSRSIQEKNEQIIENKATKKANKEKFEAIYDRIFS